MLEKPKNYILMHKQATFLEIAIAVKKKWGYVFLDDIVIQVIDATTSQIKYDQQFKITVKKQQF